MTEHTPTEQETVLYDHMNAGEWDEIDELRQQAYTAPPAEDKDLDEGTDFATPAEQFDVDYAHAHAHYQADHEPPQEEREENTREQTEGENAVAAEAEEAL